MDCYTPSPKPGTPAPPRSPRQQKLVRLKPYRCGSSSKLHTGMWLITGNTLPSYDRPTTTPVASSAPSQQKATSGVTADKTAVLPLVPAANRSVKHKHGHIHKGLHLSAPFTRQRQMLTQCLGMEALLQIRSHGSELRRNKCTEALQPITVVPQNVEESQCIAPYTKVEMTRCDKCREAIKPLASGCDEKTLPTVNHASGHQRKGVKHHAAHVSANRPSGKRSVSSGTCHTTLTQARPLSSDNETSVTDSKTNGLLPTWPSIHNSPAAKRREPLLSHPFFDKGGEATEETAKLQKQNFAAQLPPVPRQFEYGREEATQQDSEAEDLLLPEQDSEAEQERLLNPTGVSFIDDDATFSTSKVSSLDSVDSLNSPDHCNVSSEEDRLLSPAEVSFFDDASFSSSVVSRQGGVGPPNSPNQFEFEKWEEPRLPCSVCRSKKKYEDNDCTSERSFSLSSVSSLSTFLSENNSAILRNKLSECGTSPVFLTTLPISNTCCDADDDGDTAARDPASSYPRIMPVTQSNEADHSPSAGGRLVMWLSEHSHGDVSGRSGTPNTHSSCNHLPVSGSPPQHAVAREQPPNISSSPAVLDQLQTRSHRHGGGFPFNEHETFPKATEKTKMEPDPLSRTNVQPQREPRQRSHSYSCIVGGGEATSPWRMSAKDTKPLQTPPALTLTRDDNKRIAPYSRVEITLCDLCRQAIQPSALACEEKTLPKINSAGGCKRKGVKHRTADLSAQPPSGKRSVSSVMRNTTLTQAQHFSPENETSVTDSKTHALLPTVLSIDKLPGATRRAPFLSHQDGLALEEAAKLHRQTCEHQITPRVGHDLDGRTTVVCSSLVLRPRSAMLTNKTSTTESFLGGSGPRPVDPLLEVIECISRCNAACDKSGSPTREDVLPGAHPHTPLPQDASKLCVVGESVITRSPTDSRRPRVAAIACRQKRRLPRQSYHKGSAAWEDTDKLQRQNFAALLPPLPRQCKSAREEATRQGRKAEDLHSPEQCRRLSPIGISFTGDDCTNSSASGTSTEDGVYFPNSPNRLKFESLNRAENICEDNDVVEDRSCTFLSENNADYFRKRGTSSDFLTTLPVSSKWRAALGDGDTAAWNHASSHPRIMRVTPINEADHSASADGRLVRRRVEHSCGDVSGTSGTPNTYSSSNPLPVSDSPSKHGVAGKPPRKTSSLSAVLDILQTSLQRHAGGFPLNTNCLRPSPKAGVLAGSLSDRVALPKATERTKIEPGMLGCAKVRFNKGPKIQTISPCCGVRGDETSSLCGPLAKDGGLVSRLVCVGTNPNHAKVTPRAQNELEPSLIQLEDKHRTLEELDNRRHPQAFLSIRRRKQTTYRTVEENDKRRALLCRLLYSLKGRSQASKTTTSAPAPPQTHSGSRAKRPEPLSVDLMKRCVDEAVRMYPGCTDKVIVQNLPINKLIERCGQCCSRFYCDTKTWKENLDPDSENSHRTTPMQRNTQKDTRADLHTKHNVPRISVSFTL